MNKTKHVLGLSGGKDSSALAVYMNQKYPEIEMEYFSNNIEIFAILCFQYFAYPAYFLYFLYFL
jgi:tRNA(Ile)-lysidine synthase TilS/MesJ